jgi:phage gpG-like protein
VVEMTTLRFTAINKDEVIALLRARGVDVIEVLVDTMTAEMQKSADYSRQYYLSGSPLNRRTGTLSRSITGSATREGNRVIGKVGSDVVYAHVHERGGVFEIPEHMRRTGYGARGARITMLTKSGNVRAAVKSMTRGVVRAHDATFPQRAFLAPSLTDRREAIVESLRSTILQRLAGAT